MEEEDWDKAHEDDLEALAALENENRFTSRRRLSFEDEGNADVENQPPARSPNEIVIDYQLPKTVSSVFSSKRKFEETEEKAIAENQQRRELIVAKRRRVEGEKTASDHPAGASPAVVSVSLSNAKKQLNREVPKKKVYSNRPLTEPCIMVNSYNGKRVYVPLREQDESLILDPLAQREQLLSTPIKVLLDRVNQLEFAEARQKLDPRTGGEKEGTEPESQLWVDKYAPRTFTELLSDEKTNREVLYWVKEWDECAFGKKSVGIKSVSPSVRGRGGRGRGSGGRWGGQRGWGTGNNDSPTASPQSSMKSKKLDVQPQDFKTKGTVEEPSDNRPHAKVILLTGPPGLGKTTMAHVIAKQAGYNPVEINASDDRSAKIFMSKVLSATQMKSMFSEKKPNCLIIDEIDGLTGGEKGAVTALLKVINAKDKKGKGKSGQSDADAKVVNIKKSKKHKKLSDDEESYETSKLKKGSSSLDLRYKSEKKDSRSKSESKLKLDPTGKLRRPIICICNDQYAPALRELRAVARVFRFEKPDVGRLTSRLMEICNKEGLRADTQTLMALCQLADYDIRSCLNTLQFIRRKGKVLTADILASSAVGHKDVLKSLYDVWREIFQKPGSSKNKTLQHLVAKQNMEKKEFYDTLGYDPDAPSFMQGTQHVQSHFDSLYEMLSDHGEMDRIIDGCFENYLNLTFNDPCLAKANECLRWLEFTDELSLLIQKEQHFTFRKYLPIAPLAFHRNCSESSNPFITFPQSEFKMRQRRKTNKNMINTFISNSEPDVRGSLNTTLVVLELVPHLVDIISPKIRQLNPALLSEEEKAQVQNVVGTMSSFKLTYKLSNDVRKDGQEKRTNRMRLEPPLDELARFEGVKYDGRHRVLDDAQKEMIAAEIMLENIKKAERIALKKIKDVPPVTFSTPKPEEKKLSAAEEAKKRREIQEQLMKNTQKLIPEEKSVVRRDFFGRIIDTPPNKKEPSQSPVKSPRKGETTPVKDKPEAPQTPAQVFYKFHEGFTNAVRRPVYVKDFL